MSGNRMVTGLLKLDVSGNRRAVNQMPTVLGFYFFGLPFSTFRNCIPEIKSNQAEITAVFPATSKRHRAIQTLVAKGCKRNHSDKKGLRTLVADIKIRKVKNEKKTGKIN